MSVLICGAGPTGLTLAIELKRLGIPVRIIDKAPQPTQWSQALVVQARTLEQFERYGIASQAVNRGRKLHHARFFSNGREIASVDLSHIHSCYPYVLFFPQDQTEQLLNDHLQSLGGTVERNLELVALKNSDLSVEARLRHPDGTLETASARWLVGCDGAHSKVRELIDVSFEGESVPLNFFLGDLEIEGPDTPGDDLTIHLHHGDVVFIGRLGENLYRFIIALHGQQEVLAHTSLTLADFQNAIDRAGLRITARFSPWMTPFRVNDRQAERYRVKNSFLAGDAAHIHSPVGGQGMNTGIQDAANLAWKLAAVARGAEPNLIDSYDDERRAVGQALLRSTSRGLAIATTANPVLEKLRDFLAHVAELDLLQESIAAFISETAINYGESAIIYERGGDGQLHAGDRMPGPQPQSPLHQIYSVSGQDDAALRARFPHAQVTSILPDNLVGRDPKLIIVRPDGYVGFRGRHDDPALDDYARQEALAV
jgi:2-polyprenyl-6-methoxyphenol hydroxylase-like FAD-dependent oxidoreductase